MMPNVASTAGSLPGSVARPPISERAGRVERGPGAAFASGPSEHIAVCRSSNSPRSTASTCARTVLALHAWGTADPARFGWYDPPSHERLTAAERLLEMLGGLEGTPARITPLGREMLEVPVHPRLARLLIEARHNGWIHQGAAVAALLSERDIRLARKSSRAQRRSGAANRQRAAYPIFWTVSTCWPRPSRGGSFLALRSRGIDPAAARRSPWSAMSCYGAIDVTGLGNPGETTTTRTRVSSDPCSWRIRIGWSNAAVLKGQA